MSVQKKYWKIKHSNTIQRYDEDTIHHIVYQLLANRKINTAKEIKSFLNYPLDCLHNPFKMLDMDKAVDRIVAAISSGEKILIYGDYDVDGITSTVVLLTCLEKLDARVGYYIPNRQREGYGLNNAAIIWAHELGYKLIITVDCGISSVEEGVLASKLGIDLIITDHHEVEGAVPKAVAVLNPKRTDCAYPFKQLAGVGVAYKLAQALWQIRGKGREFIESLSPLVALGTVADIVPLLDENRILVKHGLDKMNENLNLGLKKLLELAGFTGNKIGEYELAFLLAPRINAIGRLEDSCWAVKLLLEKDENIAKGFAEKLNEANNERQRIEKLVMEQAEQQITEHRWDEDKIIVIVGNQWNPGVIGIVASRLVEKYYRPVIIISLEDQLGRGSGRSIDGFNLYEALCANSNLLVKFGGHPAAAGLTIEESKIEEFRENLKQYAEEVFGAREILPVLEIDMELEGRDLSLDLVEQVMKLSPFGCANREPLFLLKNLKVQDWIRMGKKGEHLKIFLNDDGIVLEGVFFRQGDLIEKLKQDCRVSVAVRLSINSWRGNKTLQLLIEDLEIHDFPSPFPAINRISKGYDSRFYLDDFDPICGDKQKEILELIYTQDKPVLAVISSKYYASRILEKIIDSLSYLGVRIVVSCPFLAGDYCLPLEDALKTGYDLIVISWEMMERDFPAGNPTLEKVGGVVKIDSEPKNIKLSLFGKEIGNIVQLPNNSLKSIWIVNSNWTKEKYNQIDPGKETMFWLCTSVDLTPMQRRGLLAQFFRSKTGILIIDLFSASELDYTNYEGDVVFLEPCITDFEWQLVNKIKEKLKGNVYKLSGDLGKDLLKRCVTERIPTPETLRGIYKYLHLVSRRQLAWNSREEFARTLAQALENRFSSFSILLGLAIFSELNLLSIEQIEGKYRFKLEHESGSKVNLEDSTVYLGFRNKEFRE